MIYTRAHKVPNWIVVDIKGKRKLKAVVDVLTEQAGAHFQPWPADTFTDYLMTFRSKGYADYLPKTYPYNLDTALLLRAVSEHMKNVVGERARIGSAYKTPPHRLDRRVEKEEDLAAIFNGVLDLEDDVGLSQIFQIGERCYSDRNNVNAYVTVGTAPLPLLTRIAKRVITIGESENSDIVINEDTKLTEIEEKLNNHFSKGE